MHGVFLRTREKCGEARAEDECLSHFSSILKNLELSNALAQDAKLVLSFIM